MSLSLRAMEVLRAVLHAGTISGGARALGVSQPAVSRMIRDAERAVGVPLFTRSPGAGSTPTPELAALGRAIERVFANVEGARGLGRVLRHGAGRVVRVALTPSLAPAFLPAAAGAMRREFPHARLVVKVREPAPIEEAIIRRDFDIGLVISTRADTDMSVEPLCVAAVVCLLPPDHPLTARRAIGPADLGDVPLLSFSGEANAGVELDRAFAAEGLARDVAIETGNSHLAAPMVRAGLGVALVDPFLVGTPALAGLEVRPFLPTIAISPKIVRLRDHVPTGPEVALIEALRATATDWADRWRQVWTVEGATRAAA
jgi:DNA-binding transcriptional LysR family regulator